MVLPLLDPGSQQITLQASVTATGVNDVFTFPSPPVGVVWTGTISVPTAPPGATFSVSVGSSPWGTFGGNSIFGPVQCLALQQVVVTAQGLTAGQPFAMTWVGSSDPSSAVQPVSPGQNSTALTAQTYTAPPGQIATFPATVSLSQTITPAAGVRTLIIQDLIGGAFSATPILNVTGAQSLLTYYDAPFYLGAVGDSYTAIVPVNPAVDSSYLVQVFGGTETHTVTISGDSEQYDESLFYNGTLQRAGSAAVGTTALVTGPARLLTAQCTVPAGAINSARLELGSGIILTADSIAASTQQTQANASWGAGHQGGVIVPAGSTLNAAIVNNGIVEVTFTYP